MVGFVLNAVRTHLLAMLRIVQIDVEWLRSLMRLFFCWSSHRKDWGWPGYLPNLHGLPLRRHLP